MNVDTAPSSTNAALFQENALALQALFEQLVADGGLAAEVDAFNSFVARFRRFAAFNAMMIYAQKPGATAVGSRAEWAAIGRNVKPDAQAIVILQPFGPIRFVYELTDTHGAPVPGDGSDPFQAMGELRPLAWNRVVRQAEHYGIDVALVSHFGAGLAGMAAKMPTDLQQGMWAEAVRAAPRKRPRKDEPVPFPYWRVSLNAAHDEPTRFATLAHELGHIYCGHLGHGPAGSWPARTGLTHSQREIEAEAVSWLVCERARIKTRSADYLRQHVSDGALKGISIFAILTAVNRVEAL